MVAIITGASRGIGFETVRYLAGKNMDDIYVISRNREGLERLTDIVQKEHRATHIHRIPLDLEQLISHPQALFKAIPDSFTHVDILINNAGSLVNKPFDQMDFKSLEKMTRVNFTAPFILIRELLPYLGKNGKSHVVNISSMGGYQGSMKFKGLSAYSATKAAIACLTECLATELNEHDVAFNCLALGATQTEMLAEAFPGYQAPLTAAQMGAFVGEFAMTGHHYFNGKIIPVSLSTP